MTRFDRRTLNEAIDACLIAAQSGACEHSPVGVAREVMARYAAVVEEAARRLITETLTDMVRRRIKAVVKSALRSQEATQGALFLPEELRDLRLPATFSVLKAPEEPAEEVSTEELERERCRWVLFKDATFRDLEQHLHLLNRGIKHDVAKRDDALILYRYLQPLMEGREDEPFAPLLQRIAEGQQRAAREKVAA